MKTAMMTINGLRGPFNLLKQDKNSLDLADDGDIMLISAVDLVEAICK